MEQRDHGRPIASRAVTAAVPAALAVLLILLVFVAESVLGADLGRYGIKPRTPDGLAGVLFAPFLHGDFWHAFNNSVALLVLGWALMYFYPRVAGRVVLLTWLLGGLGVWASARASHHIGASGVVYGLAAFLFMSGLLRRQRTLMALSLVMVFLYGSLVWGIFPFDPQMSWESHLWGGMVGVVMAWAYRAVPPAVQDPAPPQLDDDDDEEAEPEGDVPRTSMPLRIVYHSDPGDEVDEEELAWRRRLAEQSGDFGPDNTSGTWYGDEDARY